MTVTRAFRCSVFAFAVFFLRGSAPAQGPALLPPLIQHPDSEDRDGNLIVDRIEASVAKLAFARAPDEKLRVEVVLYEPCREADLDTFRALGGKVFHTFEAVSHGFSGEIPAGAVADLAGALRRGGRLCVIADDPEGRGALDVSARQARARTPEVWGAGHVGSSNTTIAILDTGIDDSHVDFSGRIAAGWTDTTSEGYASAVDYHGHGSHVAGIAAGSGAHFDSTWPGGYVSTTMSGFLPPNNNSGWFDVVEVKKAAVNALQILLLWVGGGTGEINARDPSWAWMTWRQSSDGSVSYGYTTASAGIYRPYFGNVSGAGGKAYRAVVAVDYLPVGDGYSLFRGMAPGSKLLGVKVLKDDKSGFSTDWGEGLDWCVTNRDTYKIRVVNLSLGLDFGDTEASLDTKVENAVRNGIVVVCAAMNEFGKYTIPSPANAPKAIAVGAINDEGAMTNYSSNGTTGQGKPDVVACGGSAVAGTRITSVETNDGEAQGLIENDSSDDDYANMQGTSMATPHVSGLAALLIDAQEKGGDPWSYTEAEVLGIKNIILMTATETNKTGELKWNDGNAPTEPSGNDPTLDRGGRDRVEGFGKINADAAVEAVTQALLLDESSDAITFGSDPLARKAAARNVSLTAGKSYDLMLDLVSGHLDCDLYLYDSMPDSTGSPVILTKATSAAPGTSEQIIKFPAPRSGTFYMVAKYVAGAETGDYILQLKASRGGFKRGDVNVDEEFDMSDAIAALGNLFLGNPAELACEKSADSNDDGGIDLSDAVHMLRHLYLGGAAPAEPFEECGEDTTPDDLTCESFPPCE